MYRRAMLEIGRIRRKFIVLALAISNAVPCRPLSEWTPNNMFFGGFFSLAPNGSAKRARKTTKVETAIL